MTRQHPIRQAFADQAQWCEQLGSPFTARLCAVLGQRLDDRTAVGRRVLGWPGDPQTDALALRLCGGLHSLVRSGGAPDLAALYPPAPLPGEAALADALTPVLAARSEALQPWLDGAPQTNEVGRSAVLMGGLLVLAERYGLPLRLYELGASAGLNLQLDSYSYQLGGLEAGARDSPVRLAPDWQGAPPPGAPVRIAGRAGVDLDPLDPVADGDRLLAYVWPDQPERIARIEAALRLARENRPQVMQGDAADWIEARLAREPEPGICRVVLHSVAFQYFPPAIQARVRARIDQAGAFATQSAPLAWLRLEKLEADEAFSLRLRCWPGEDQLLAWSHPHGHWIDWRY